MVRDAGVAGAFSVVVAPRGDHHGVMRWLAQWFLRVRGWNITGIGELPKKFVALGVPHTSNWDFIAFLAVISRFGVHGQAIGKQALTSGRFGGFMRRMGVIPVDRDRPGGIVQQMVDEFAAAEEMALIIAPEGTRSLRDHWKSGFYRIALAADVPVVLAYIDYERKETGFGAVIHLTGRVREDMDKIRAFYATKGPGRHPERASQIRLRMEDEEQA